VEAEGGGSQRFVLSAQDNSVGVWGLASGQMLHRRPMVETPMQYRGQSLKVWEAKGRVFMAVGLNAGLIKVVDLGEKAGEKTGLRAANKTG
jgi:hypothetical protein